MDRDYTEFRRLNMCKGLDPEKMNKSYKLFYDEFNNVRKFRVKDGRFNVDPLMHFVLGGLCGNVHDVEFEELKSLLDLNATVQEIKSHNIYDGDFLSALNSNRVTKYLELVNSKCWLFHFSSINLFYYSIVDIVDSLDYPVEYTFHLKDVMSSNLPFSLDVFIKYSYPNIPTIKINNFINDVVSLVDMYINDGHYADIFFMLRCVLICAKDSSELTFVQNEEEGQLIKSLAEFYIQEIYMFKNAIITFDEEKQVLEYINGISILVDGNCQSNYSFVDSKDSIMIQLSDVFVGLVGRYLDFIMQHINDIDYQIKRFNECQRKNFTLLNKILNNSQLENNAFINQFTSINEHNALLRQLFLVGQKS